MWRESYAIERAICGEALIIKAAWEEETFFLPPFGPEESLEPALQAMEAYAATQGLPFIIRGAERYIVDWLENLRPGYWQAGADRDNFDYVYASEDLISLRGRKYHGKKNHVNGFYKSYPDAEYRPLTAELTAACSAFTLEWCAERNCQKGDVLDCEKDAILEAMQNFTALGFVGGTLFVAGQMVAFTFGEAIHDGMAVIHVEKGKSGVKGVYAAMNQAFCEQAWSGIPYVNREEDMGVEGLRTAKESYHPHHYVEKYVIVPKQ